MAKQIFNKTAALELTDNDEDLLNILISSFLEVEFSMEELNKLISARNFEEAAAYVHKTKGAGRQLCMEKLAESGQNLEDVLRGKKEGNIQELSEIMNKDYQEAIKAVS